MQPPEDTTPELQDEINAVWGTWGLLDGTIRIPDANKGTWSYAPESWQYQWFYSIDDTNWLPLTDGSYSIYDDDATNYHVSYTVTGTTTDSVSMTATGNRNTFRECVYVKAQVKVTHGTFTTDWVDSNELARDAPSGAVLWIDANEPCNTRGLRGLRPQIPHLPI